MNGLEGLPRGGGSSLFGAGGTQFLSASAGTFQVMTWEGAKKKCPLKDCEL